MAKTLPIQESFAAGEISPRLYGRSSIEGYQAGVQSMINWITTPHGPFYRRKGFKFVESRTYTSNTFKHTRILPFNTPSGDYFVILDYTLADYIRVVKYENNMDFDSDDVDVTIVYASGWGITFYDYTLQYAVSPDGNTMYLVSNTKTVFKITHTDPGGNDPIEFDFDIVSFTSPPAAWTGTGSPFAIEFHQNRLWLAGGRGSSIGIWASKSGDYEDFTTGSADDDALDFTVPQRGDVLWMRSVRKLLVGTSVNEFTISASGGVITPSDIQADIQSEYGSSQIQPIRIGNSIIYVSSDGRKLREVNYSWTDDNWNSRDLLFASEHLTEDDRILGLAFAQVPDLLLFVRTVNGNLLIATYDKANNIIGWHRHDTNAELLDICALRDSETKSGRDIVMVSFVRSFTTLTRYYEVYGGEFFDANTLLKTIDEQYLDCWHLITNDPASDEITGITALANQTVGVIADGVLQDDITLDENGDGTLEVEAEEVIIGLNYECYMKTLPLAKSVPFGSTTPMKKKRNQFFVKLINSVLPKINGQRPLSTEDTETLRTTDLQVTLLGWDRKSEIEITQELPFPTMIASIYGDATEETL